MSPQRRERLPPMRVPDAVPRRRDLGRRGAEGCEVRLRAGFRECVRLPAGAGLKTVRSRESIVKEGQSGLIRSELSMGPWKEIKLDLRRKAQCRAVISLKPIKIFGCEWMAL